MKNELNAALAHLGITCKITIPGRVATVGLAHVLADNEHELVPQILAINKALQDAGLLSKWRAKKGGSSTERWILLIGAKNKYFRA